MFFLVFWLQKRVGPIWPTLWELGISVHGHPEEDSSSKIWANDFLWIKPMWSFHSYLDKNSNSVSKFAEILKKTWIRGACIFMIYIFFQIMYHFKKAWNSIVFFASAVSEIPLIRRQQCLRNAVMPSYIWQHWDYILQRWYVIRII